MVKVRVFQPTVGGDGMIPHQIPHTEIVKGLVIGEVGHSSFKDMLRGGIGSMAISGVIPGAGGTPPDMGIVIDPMRVTDVRRIITRDVGEIVNIVARAGRHVLVLLVSDEGDDGIVPQTTIPYITYPLA